MGDDRSTGSMPARGVQPHAIVAIAATILLLLGVCGVYEARGRTTGEEGGRVVALADTIPAATLALGERVYRGKAGGALCVTCHGANAKGVAGIGPDLTDGTWLHGSGEMPFLKQVIRAGVPKPKQTGAIMPPLGGGSLSPAQVDAVAAYVYSLSH